MSASPARPATPPSINQPHGRRIFNFSAGPCTLPVPVLEQLRDQMLNHTDADGPHGMGLIEMSHRSKPVQRVRDEAVSLLREVLHVPDTHHVAFIGGGATMQFGMVPMNLLHPSRRAAYADLGAWSTKAIKDARTIGEVDVVFDGSQHDYMSMPEPADLTCDDDAAYLHLCSNETIAGLQMKSFPRVAPPLVCDMSSDFLSRPIDVADFGLIYAGAQKNIGPAGVAVIIIADDLMQQARTDQVGYLNYAGHVKGDSMLNTPPVFQIWAVGLVLAWLRDQGGLAWAQQQAEARSRIVYDAIADSGGFYRCPVDERFRSQMNITFRLPDEALEARFIREADDAGMSGLKGHRSVGGCRASLYNAMPLEGARALSDFMGSFAAANG